MRNFLIAATILDGEHEHTAHALLKADSEKQARAWADKQCDDANKGYFSYRDGLTRTKLSSVTEIKAEVVRLIELLGLAYFA